MIYECQNAYAVAKRAIYLAYKAANLGAFYGDKDTATEDQVWDDAYNMPVYRGRGNRPAGEVKCDYVLGKMMKFTIEIKSDTTIEIPDCKPKLGAWTSKYRSFTKLFDAAVKDLKDEEKSIKILNEHDDR